MNIRYLISSPTQQIHFKNVRYRSYLREPHFKAEEIEILQEVK